jgi:hypothetical protein
MRHDYVGEEAGISSRFQSGTVPPDDCGPAFCLRIACNLMWYASPTFAGLAAGLANVHGRVIQCGGGCEATLGNKSDPGP